MHKYFLFGVCLVFVWLKSYKRCYTQAGSRWVKRLPIKVNNIIYNILSHGLFETFRS